MEIALAKFKGKNYVRFVALLFVQGQSNFCILQCQFTLKHTHVKSVMIAYVRRDNFLHSSKTNVGHLFFASRTRQNHTPTR